MKRKNFFGLAWLFFVVLSLIIFSCKPRRGGARLSGDDANKTVFEVNIDVKQELFRIQEDMESRMLLPAEIYAVLNEQERAGAKNRDEIENKLKEIYGRADITFPAIEHKFMAAGLLVRLLSFYPKTRENIAQLPQKVDGIINMLRSDIARAVGPRLSQQDISQTPTCPSVTSCQMWLDLFLVHTPRVSFAYQPVKLLLNNMLKDLKSYPSNAFVDAQILSVDTAISERDFMELSNFEGVLEPGDNESSELAILKTPEFQSIGGDNQAEIGSFKQSLKSKLELYRQKFQSGNNPETLNIGVFENISEHYIHTFGVDFDNKSEEDLKASAVRKIQDYTLSVSECLSVLHALYEYSSRMGKYDYREIRQWAADIKSRSHQWFTSYQNVINEPSSREGLVSPIDNNLINPLTVTMLITRFGQRESLLPTVVYFNEIALENMRKMKSLSFYGPVGMGNQYLHSLGKFQNQFVERMKSRKDEAHLLFESTGMSKAEITALVNNELEMTRFRGFHSLTFQGNSIRYAATKLGVAQSTMQRLKQKDKDRQFSKEEFEEFENIIKNAEVEAASKVLALRCMLFNVGNLTGSSRSSQLPSFVDAKLFHVNLANSQGWCDGSSVSSFLGGAWMDKSCQSPSDKRGLINLSNPAVCPSADNVFSYQQRASSCLTAYHIFDTCSDLNLQITSSVVSTLATPIVVMGAASALTRLTYTFASRIYFVNYASRIVANSISLGRGSKSLITALTNIGVESIYFSVLSSTISSFFMGSTVFYDPNQSFSDNMKYMAKSYLMSFAFFGFARNMHSWSHSIHRQIAKRRLLTKDPSKLEKAAEYLKNFDDIEMAKRLSPASFNPRTWTSFSARHNLIATSVEYSGFLAIGQGEAKFIDPVFERYFIGKSHSHISDLKAEPWLSMATAEPFIHNAVTVASFRLRQSMGAFQNHVVQPMEQRTYQFMDRMREVSPLARFGISSRAFESALKSEQDRMRIAQEVGRYFEVLSASAIYKPNPGMDSAEIVALKEQRLELLKKDYSHIMNLIKQGAVRRSQQGADANAETKVVDVFPQPI